jgi:hypothetical protein
MPKAIHLKWVAMIAKEAAGSKGGSCQIAIMVGNPGNDPGL